MRKPLFTERRVLTALIVLLAILSVLPSHVVQPVTDPARHVVEALLYPRQWLISASAALRRPADLSYGLTDDLSKLRRDYMRLDTLRARLEQKVAADQQTIGQLMQIRQQLNTAGMSLLPAAVAGWGGAASPTLVINRGWHSGVHSGLAVVADGINLVGQVSDVGPGTATVQLITAPGSHFTARILPLTPQADTPPIIVLLKLNDDGRTFSVTVPNNSPIKVGDFAHLADGDWPAESRGMIIGKVVRVTRLEENPRLFHRVTVQPVTQLSHLTQVFVLVPVSSDQKPN